MRTIQTYFSVVAVVGLLFGVSCERSESPDPTQPVQVPPAVTSITKSSELTSDDAVKVAEMFHAANAPTRAAQRVRNVVTVPDAEGRPAIYAVNLEDGYLLVSATKRYYPILAQVDHGTFTLDGERFGLHVVLQEMVETIEAVRADSTLVPQSKYAWFPYEERTVSRPQIATTRSDMNDLVACQDRWYTKWADEGCNCYPLFRKPEGLPDAVYQRFCELADGDDPWAGTPFNCMETAVITERQVRIYQNIGPFISTKWHQGKPYNSAVSGEGYLGCVAIAVGQLMRYFEHPSTFNWASMPNTTSTDVPVLSTFLARLRTELGITNSHGAKPKDALRVLSNYGYSCQLYDHSGERVVQSLNQKRPVYTRGIDRSRDEGHAWIIDGYFSDRYYTEYTLYVLDGAAYPNFDYFDIDFYRIDSPSSVLFSMNWGWGGDYDGWYNDDGVVYTKDKEIYNYSSERKDIIITGH